MDFKAPLKRLKLYGELVMFSHTLFSLPFALAAMLIASGGFPGWKTFLWIAAAFAGARNGANALNRIIDRRIDARNPRTSGRHLPSGQLTLLEAVLLAGFCFLLLIVAASQLNRLCLELLPIAVVLFIFYSYTKRFTWLCHLILGAACAGASFGAWIAVTGKIELPAFVLAAANALWVAGFDILYATLDIDFDRANHLQSIPARFGAVWAVRTAAFFHFLTVLLLATTGYLMDLGWVFYTGVGAVSLLLAAEHLLIEQGRFKRVEFASYRMNQIIGVVFLLFTGLDILLL